MRLAWQSLAALAITCPIAAQAGDDAALLRLHDGGADLTLSGTTAPDSPAGVTGEAALDLSLPGLTAQLKGSAHSASSRAPLTGTSGQDGATAQLDTEWTDDAASLHLHAEHTLDLSAQEGANGNALYIARSMQQNIADSASATISVKPLADLTLQAAARTTTTQTVQSQWLDGTTRDSRVESDLSAQSAKASWTPLAHVTMSAETALSDGRLKTQSGPGAQVSWQAMEPRVALTVQPFSGASVTLEAERSIQPVSAANLAAWRAASSTAGPAGLKPDAAREFTASVQDTAGPLSLSAAYTDAGIASTTVLGQGPDGQIPQTISGGTRQSASASLALSLDGLGLEGAKLSSHGVWRGSRILDPVTGEDRPLSGEVPREAEIKLSQTLPGRHLSFGVAGNLGTQTHYYQLAVDTAVTQDPSVGAFVEYHPGPFALKLDVQGLGGGTAREDTYYFGNRAGGVDHVTPSRSGGPSIGLTFTRNTDG